MAAQEKMTTAELINKVFTEFQTELKQAQQCVQQGDLIGAETVYKAILAQAQDYPPALQGLSVLANAIDDQQVREDLLRRAISKIDDLDGRDANGLAAIWLAELAEALILQDKQDEAQQCIDESKRIIEENLKA